MAGRRDLLGPAARGAGPARCGRRALHTRRDRGPAPARRPGRPGGDRLHESRRAARRGVGAGRPVHGLRRRRDRPVAGSTAARCCFAWRSTIPAPPRRWRDARGRSRSSPRASWSRWSSRCPRAARRTARCASPRSPDELVRVISVASGLGNTSAYTWLKVHVTEDMERVLEATTLPTLLLGGDPGDSAGRGVRGVEARAPDPAGARAGGGPRPAVSARWRRRGRGVRGGKAGARMSERLHWPAGTLTAGRRPGGDDAERRRVAVHRAARHPPVSRGRRVGSRPGRREMLVLPLCGGCAIEGVRPSVHARRPRRASSTGITDFAYLPVGAEVVLSSAGRRRVGAAFGGRGPAAPRRLRAGQGRRGGGARGGKRHPPGQQLLRRRWRAGAPAGGGRGADAGRQLVLLPAAQARRRSHGGGSGAGGDLLLPHSGHGRLRDAPHLHGRPRDRRDGGRAGRGRVPGAARLPRPLRRAARVSRCTTSTCWPAPATRARSASATTRATPGSGGPGPACRGIRACRSWHRRERLGEPARRDQAAHHGPGAGALPGRAARGARRGGAAVLRRQCSGSSATATWPAWVRPSSSTPSHLRYYQSRNEQAQVHAAAGYARMRNRLQTLACTSSVGPGATNMITGAAGATINRLPVLLLPGRRLRQPTRGRGPPAARGGLVAGRLGQRRVPAGVAVLGPHRASRAARVLRARGDARAHQPGGHRRGDAGAAAGRSGGGVRLPGRVPGAARVARAAAGARRGRDAAGARAHPLRPAGRSSSPAEA